MIIPPYNSRVTRRTLAKLIVLFVSLGFCLAVLELAVRALSRRDIDGEWRFRSTRLRPYQLPVKRVERDVAAYQKSDKTALIWDADLGWSQRPSVADHNDAGFITIGPTPAREKTPGKLRIALFGDSFTQANYETGWWRVLEEELNRRGVSCEVLNFGVGGYGMDQAYLRWKRDGAPWNPDVVVFGFFAEDCYRNLNTLRLLRDPDSGIPFLKPRFVLDGDGLRLIGSPTLRPEAIAGAVRDFAGSSLAAHEWFFRPSDFQMNAWRWSRLAALAESKARLTSDAGRAEEFFRLEGEASQIALRLMRQMKAEVEERGAQFWIAHLPGETDLAALQKAGKIAYQDLYQALRKDYRVIPLELALLKATGTKPLPGYFGDGHYGAELNAVVGREIASGIAASAPR